MNAVTVGDSGLLKRLNGILRIDRTANLTAALEGGCRVGTVIQRSHSAPHRPRAAHYGAGVLNETYLEYPRRNGYRL